MPDHDDALHLALLKKEESNLARCYLDLREIAAQIVKDWDAATAGKPPSDYINNPGWAAERLRRFAKD